MKSNLKTIIWAILVVLIGFSFVSFFFDKAGRAAKPEESTASAVETSSANAPQLSYFLKNPDLKPKASAEAFLAGDLDTGEIILEKNEENIFPLASVSKLMTALSAIETGKANDIATISKNALSTYGKNGNLKTGEKLPVSELLYPLLLESSNDAAEAIAEHFNRDFFIKKMNQTAEKLGLSGTSFEDPSGLSENNKSTVLDMFKLAGYIEKNHPDIFKTATNKKISDKKHVWFSNSQFLGDEGYLGGKSGYTDVARQTVISVFSVPLGQEGARNIAIALLKSDDRHKDVENILKYLKINVYYGGAAEKSANWIKENKNVSEIYDQDYVNLAFGGDMMFDRGVKNSVNKNFAGDYSALFEKLGLFQKADISFANLEGPVSDIGKDRHNLYSFRMNPSVLPALRGAGFSVLSVANNHVADWGTEAYSDTLAGLKENEILYIGGGVNKNEAETPAVIEKYGIKVGYLGFSDVGPSGFEAKENSAGVLFASNPRFSEIIQNASKQVDFLVVSIHFGEEYKEKHNKRQEYLAHKAIDAGAKFVIGHHPHVAEDTEIYKNGFIAYSLGNLIFDQGFSTATMQGMILEAKLNRDGSMSVKKDTVKSNKIFQPEKIIFGKEEKIKFKN